MKINQVYEIVNNATSQVLGVQDLLQEDLSNIVDTGKKIIGADQLDNYVKSLVNHIGKVVFDNRVYEGNKTSVLMDSWEYGSILEKITADIPVAHENSSWNLKDGQFYNQDVFVQPKVSAKFFSSKVTFEIPISFTELQVKESFSNVEQLNGFLSMLYNAVEKSMKVKTDELVQKVINNAIAETLVSDLKTKEGTLDLKKSGVKAINLLADYNKKQGTTVTPEKAIYDPDFIRYASYIINLTSDRLTKISTLFNVEKKERFTPKEEQNIILLSDFASATQTYLFSDTFHNELVKLPDFETVPFWQGSGKNYGFDDVSGISVKTADGEVVETSGILGVILDRQAVAVCNTDNRVTTNYNAKAEFYNNFYKSDNAYFNDLQENTVVFFVA